MWRAYLALKTYHRRPNEDLDLCEPDDGITAWCVDDMVMWFGTTIEKLLSETRKIVIGKETRREPLYTLEQLLDPRYHPPRPMPAKRLPTNPWQPIMDMVNRPSSGIRAWRYVAPEVKAA